MESKLTPLFGKFMADDLREQFASEANAYIGIGRSTLFGANPNDIDDILYTTNEYNQIYRNLVALKKIQPSDLQLMVARNDWQSGSVYDAYSDEVEHFTYDKLTSIGTANANANTVLTGTVSISGSNTVTGSGTTFTEYLFAGDQISVNGSVKTVVSVPTNLLAIVDSNFANTNSSQTITLVKNNITIVANSASFIGSVFPGNTIVIGNDSREVVSVRSNKVISVNTKLSISSSNTLVFRKDNTYPKYASSFYVRNTRDQVFKCLFNNSNTVSTIEPTIDIDGQLPENPFILTSDGYKWKYLYTIAPGLKQKFFTKDWMPIANNNPVALSAVDGRIDVVNVLWGGSGHLGGSSSNTAKIIEITNTDGVGANLIARVLNGVIVGASVLNGGNNYTRGTVAVVDPNKLGSTTLTGTVNVSGTVVSGNLSNTTYFTGNVLVNDIIVVNGESRNVVSVTNDTSLTVNIAFTAANTQIATIQRSEAVLDLEIGPQGGHGSYPAKELGARTLMATVELNGTENTTIPISDLVNTFDFNQISVISNPVVANDAFVASGTNYRVSTRVLVSDPGISNFIDDETVYVGPSLPSATMVANVVHWDSGDNYLYINNITGSFIPGDLIRSDGSGIVTTVLGISNSEIKLYSGDLLYTENRKNVVRDADQIEQVRLVLTF